MVMLGLILDSKDNRHVWMERMNSLRREVIPRIKYQTVFAGNELRVLMHEV